MDVGANVGYGRSMIHGESGVNATPEYRSWESAIRRCTNPKSEKFKHYGGRGIKVHESWRDYRNFLRDMGRRPQGTTLDRIDVNGDYAPGNCRWADHKTQRAGRRDSNLTHCRNGHELTADNLYIAKRPDRPGERACRICRREAGRRGDAKRKPGWARTRESLSV